MYDLTIIGFFTIFAVIYSLGHSEYKKLQKRRN